MDTDLLKILEYVQVATGLSDQRVGYLLANNSALFGRVRDGGSCRPSTRARVFQGALAELQKRGLEEEAAQLSLLFPTYYPDGVVSDCVAFSKGAA